MHGCIPAYILSYTSETVSRKMRGSAHTHTLQRAHASAASPGAWLQSEVTRSQACRDRILARHATAWNMKKMQ